MRKYWQYFRLGFLSHIEYRFDILIFRIADLVRFVALVYLWMNVYDQTKTLSGFTFKDMVGYYVGVMILGNLIERGFWSGQFDNDIREGYLSFTLVKPVRYLIGRFFHGLGGKVVHAIFMIGIICPLAYFMGFLPLPSLGELVIFLFSITLGLILYYSWFSLINCLAFWTVEVHGIRFLFQQVLVGILKGGLVPLVLLPAWFASILNFLPFGYFFYFPLMVYLGKISSSEIVFGLSIQLAWVMMFMVLIALVWKAGLKKYQAVGG